MVERISSRTDSADELSVPDMADFPSIIRVPGAMVNQPAQDTAQSGRTLTTIARGCFATRFQHRGFHGVPDQQKSATDRSCPIGRIGNDDMSGIPDKGRQGIPVAERLGHVCCIFSASAFFCITPLSSDAASIAFDPIVRACRSADAGELP